MEQYEKDAAVNNMEVERKFLMKKDEKKLEKLQLLSRYNVEQGYLNIPIKVRISKKLNLETLISNYSLTIREKEDVSKKIIDVEIELSEDKFDTLKGMIHYVFTTEASKEFILEQGYLYRETEVRIRKKLNLETLKTNYRLTIKGDGDISRKEVEVDLNVDIYNILKSTIPYVFITKDFKKFALENGLILEYSIVNKDKQTEFSYAEIEFLDIEEAGKFIAADYLGKEVTYVQNYKMKNFWINSRVKKVD